MKAKKLIRNAKKEAYAAKQEQEGRNVINWIFGVLVVLAIVLVVYLMAVGV